MPVNVVMPKLGLTMKEGRVDRWLKKVGDIVKKGEEKGYFLFGGSTCILVLEKDKVVIDEDIIKNTQNKIETRIYMGEKFGNEKN